LNIGTGSNTCTVSSAGWIGTYPGSLSGGMCARSAEIRTERRSKKMGKIVVKGDWNQRDVRIHSMGLNRTDAAKMLLAAFISITETLDDDIKKATFLAALSCCRDEVYSPKIEVIK